MISLKSVAITSWIVSIIALFLYSYTQVDLSLTLSQASLYQTIEKGFQYIGWFNRPLSAYLFGGLLLLLFTTYIFLFNLARQGKLGRDIVWKLIFFSTIVLTFSYNAFSYDLFNYIFDAKIITHYAQNPYLHKALDYPSEPMLSFMRWTHRVYPYGPFWLVLTVPISFLGLGYFFPTFLLFKIGIAGSFLLGCYYLEKALRSINTEKTIASLVFFAFNPLVLIESLVSAHIDTVMMAFCIGAFYLLLKRKYFSSAFVYILSIGIKFATGFLLPVILWKIILKKKIDNTFMYTSILLMIAAVLVSTYWSGNFQPWYLLLVLPFCAFVSNDKKIFFPSLIISFLSLLQYLPYIYLGNWDPPVPMILASLNIAGIIVSFITIMICIMKRAKKLY